VAATEGLDERIVEVAAPAGESAPPTVPAQGTPGEPQFVVQPYIVYPADKPIVPEYKTAVDQLTPEIRDWYRSKVGKTFTVLAAQELKSGLPYLDMRCGAAPSEKCKSDPSDTFLIGEGKEQRAYFLDIALRVPALKANAVNLIFAVGGGGISGGNFNTKDSVGFAVVGDWVLEPISEKRNDWGIPCSFATKDECALDTAKGTVAHELGHAFGLSPFPGLHPPEGADTIMDFQGKYPSTGFLPEEKAILFNSPFFK
jgi:hypothetical protein